MLTLAELGVLRDVTTEPTGRVVVSITPTYTGCPALDAMRDNLRTRLRRAGLDQVEVRTVLNPPWTTDWITESGRRKLAEAGIAPPGPTPLRTAGPIPLSLGPTRRGARPPRCPQCGSRNTRELSRFSATACRSLRLCDDCREPFEHLKEI